MPFLRGSLGFERFSVQGFNSKGFDDEHLSLLSDHAAGRTQTESIENVHVGFLGGAHLFDQDFDLGKNLVNHAVHCGIRIDTNQIPSSIRNAWLQMELAGFAKDSPTGVPTKSQRKEAKEAVEQRCQTEVASGKYRKMQQFPLLWDYCQDLLYFGGSVGNASGHCVELLERTFGIELRRVTAGSIALQWATEADRFAEVDDLMPACFVSGSSQASHAWSNEHSQAPDFLGNEFLLWLWWRLENESDTLTLPDGTDVTVMLAKTLTLECPRGESGKETITSESPIQLPEAMQAVRSGKLPRKTGMSIVRHDRQIDLVLQAETFGISGAKIHLRDDEEFSDDDRIDTIRSLSETTDLMFQAFCDVRTSPSWGKTQKQMTGWLKPKGESKQQAA